MKLPPVRKRRHGRAEEITIHDLDPYLTVPDDALVGSASDTEVVFIGPVGVGKTTAVQSLSSVDPINTEVTAAAPGEFFTPDKTATTVGIDYGMWKRADGSVVGLFGTAGQERFDDARAPLRNPDAGIVLWVFGQHKYLRQQVEDWLATAGGPQQSHRVVVALNFAEEGAVDAMRRILDEMGLYSVAATVADPRVKEDVARVVTMAIGFLEDEHRV